jgi:hypothetical protein
MVVCGTCVYVLPILHFAPCLARLHPRPRNHLSCLRTLYLCIVSGYAEPSACGRAIQPCSKTNRHQNQLHHLRLQQKKNRVLSLRRYQLPFSSTTSCDPRLPGRHEQMVDISSFTNLLARQNSFLCQPRQTKVDNRFQKK